MRYLLNLVYIVLLVVLSPWLLYRALFQKKNRRGWWTKLTGRVGRRESTAPCIWFHAVSVGEVNLLKPLIEEILEEMPGCEFAVSTTTESGYDLACKLYGNGVVFFCPFDFSWAIRNVLRRIRPSLLVLAELEFWPNLISVTHSQGIPVSLVNGRISNASFENYARFKWFWRPRLGQIAHLGVQNQEYARRLIQLGVDSAKIQVTGSVKFDGANTDCHNSHTSELRELIGLQDGDFVFMAGSTQPEEDMLAADVFASLKSAGLKFQLILVPRHVHRSAKLKKDLMEMGLSAQLRSEIQSDSNSPVFDDFDVLIVDVIGELSSWWGVAGVAFVGGTMGRRGGQNMIEPAAYGVPVCFGPNTWNFRDVVQLLLDRHAGQVVCSRHELLDFVRSSIQQPQLAQQMGLRGQQLVIQQKGAVRRTVAMLLDILVRHDSQESISSSKSSVAA